MVLYKLPISRKASLLAASGYDRVKSYINRVARWSFDEPEMTPLHIIGSAKKLKQWTLVTDSMFGGASACKLGYTKNDTFLFEGELFKLSNGKIVLPSFARMWYIYYGFHKDFSENDGVRIKYRLLSESTIRNFQFQLLHSDFIDDTFFFATFADANQKEYVNQWQVVKIPFDVLRVNKFGVEGQLFRSPPVHDVMGIGIGVSDTTPGPFQIEIKSIDAYNE